MTKKLGVSGRNQLGEVDNSLELWSELPGLWMWEISGRVVAIGWVPLDSYDLMFQTIEPRKTPGLTTYFPLNPGSLMTGSLRHGLWNNPHITG